MNKCSYADKYQAKRAPTCGCRRCEQIWEAKRENQMKPLTNDDIIRFMNQGAPLENRGRAWTLSGVPIDCTTIRTLESSGAITVTCHDATFAKAELNL